MIRSLVIVALSALAVLAAPVPDCPKQSRGLIPQEVIVFVGSLTKVDKAVLKEVGNDKSIKNEEELLTAIMARSPSLGYKVKKLYYAFVARIEALGDEAKKFVKDLIKEARDEYNAGAMAPGNYMEKADDVFARYFVLSKKAKDELEENFPISSFFFQAAELFKQFVDEK